MKRRVGRRGHGKWRLNGRGGTLKCWRQHQADRQCRVCGVQLYGVFADYDFAALLSDLKREVITDIEVGIIERVRFIQA